MHWAIGSALAWPFAAAVGRRFKQTRGGVPYAPLQRICHDFPHPEPGRVSRLRFRYYSFLTAAAGGWCFAKWMADPNIRASNTWYNRPDLKPKAAMVNEPGSVTQTTMIHD